MYLMQPVASLKFCLPMSLQEVQYVTTTTLGLLANRTFQLWIYITMNIFYFTKFSQCDWDFSVTHLYVYFVKKSQADLLNIFCFYFTLKLVQVLLCVSDLTLKCIMQQCSTQRNYILTSGDIRSTDSTGKVLLKYKWRLLKLENWSSHA